MQPETRIFFTFPAFFSSAISKMFSMASSQAEARKPQVFTTTTSAPSGPAWTVLPAAWAAAIICSQFTWFLAQPREINATLYAIVSLLPGLAGEMWSQRISKRPLFRLGARGWASEYPRVTRDKNSPFSGAKTSRITGA